MKPGLALELHTAQAEMPPAPGPWNPVPVERKVERRRYTNQTYITCLKMNFQYIKRYRNDSSDLVELLHRENSYPLPPVTVVGLTEQKFQIS